MIRYIAKVYPSGTGQLALEAIRQVPGDYPPGLFSPVPDEKLSCLPEKLRIKNNVLLFTFCRDLCLASID